MSTCTNTLTEGATGTITMTVKECDGTPVPITLPVTVDLLKPDGSVLTGQAATIVDGPNGVISWTAAVDMLSPAGLWEIEANLAEVDYTGPTQRASFNVTPKIA